MSNNDVNAMRNSTFTGITMWNTSRVPMTMDTSDARDALKMDTWGDMTICIPLYEIGKICSCKKDCTECKLGAEYIIKNKR